MLFEVSWGNWIDVDFEAGGVGVAAGEDEQKQMMGCPGDD